MKEVRFLEGVEPSKEEELEAAIHYLSERQLRIALTKLAQEILKEVEVDRLPKEALCMLEDAIEVASTYPKS